MNIGNQILNVRKEKQLTQEEFGRLFHVYSTNCFKLGKWKKLS